MPHFVSAVCSSGSCCNTGCARTVLHACACEMTVQVPGKNNFRGPSPDAQNTQAVRRGGSLRCETCFRASFCRHRRPISRALLPSSRLAACNDLRSLSHRARVHSGAPATSSSRSRARNREGQAAHGGAPQDGDRKVASPHRCPGERSASPRRALHRKVAWIDDRHLSPPWRRADIL